MSQFKILSILLILLVSTIAIDKTLTKDSRKEVKSDNSAKEEATPTPAPSSAPSPTLKKLNIEIITDDVTPVPTAIPPSSSNFTYPNSQSLGASSFSSTDDPQVITDWYKNKIQQEGYNAKSFVQTKTNGNVKNVLAAGADGKDIKVEITKENNSSVTRINISGNY